MRFYKLLLTIVFFNITLLANTNLYVFVFKDGVALQDTKIQVGNLETKTNEYGYAQFTNIKSDTYEVSYYKDEKLFALSEVNIVPNQDSQLFLTLTHDNANVDLDLPLDAYNKDFQQVKMKKLEGPKGRLTFTLQDSKSNDLVKKAKLFFKGYQLEANSDENGVVNIEIPKGKYDISIVHPNYVMKVLTDVEIKEKKTTTQVIKLTKSDISLQEYIVLAPAVEGSLASTFAELKDSDTVGDAISAEQFSKSGDSSAAGALKRVTGITIVDDKYVYVRGLGERYSTILLNGLHIPSPEPTKRVVPLDIFPTGVIQSMNIQKTFSPDIPGTFAGGSVLIKTKDIPKEDNYVQADFSLNYNSSTGKDAVYNADNANGLSANLISKSSDFQEIQKGYPSLGIDGYTDEQLAEINENITQYRSYNIDKKTIEPGKNISLGAGQSFKTSKGLKYGFVGSLYYKTDANAIDATRYSTNYDIPTAVLTNGEKSDYQETTLSEKYGGIVSFGVQNDNHKFKYSLLSLNETSSSTTYSQKDGGQEGVGQDDEEKVYLEYLEKTIQAHQFNGEHYFQFGKNKDGLFDDLEVEWGFETSTATRLEPGTVEYTYERTSDTTDMTLNKKIWYMYSDLEDTVDNYRVDLKLPYENNNRDNYLSFGTFIYNKSRTLDNRRFKAEHSLGTEVYEDIDSVFTQENAQNGSILLTSNYRSDDAYTATQDVTAVYINNLFSLREDTDLIFGIRQENSSQELIDTESGEPYEPLETSDLLPSLGITHRFNDEHQLRFGYADSLSRPDFREFSPNRYKDPITDDIIFGNPDLEYTKITNIDLKYEWFMSFDEYFSFALFQKDFVNPIETITNIDTNSQEGNKIISYRNALGATSTGIELGARKNLNFIHENLKNYFISFNYSKIDSKIDLDKNSDDAMIKELTTTNRAMQGQSPYIVNYQMGYDNFFTGRSVILLYNEFGERISSLGTYGAPDYYEKPFRKFDFVVKWQLNDSYDINIKKTKWVVKFKATNLLDSDVKITQGDVISKTYSPGKSYNLSLSVKY